MATANAAQHAPGTCRWCSKPIGDADLMHPICVGEWSRAGRFPLIGTVACALCSHPTSHASETHADCAARARLVAAIAAHRAPTYYSTNAENAEWDRADAELDIESNRYGDGRGCGETDVFNPRGAW